MHVVWFFLVLREKIVKNCEEGNISAHAMYQSTQACQHAQTCAFPFFFIVIMFGTVLFSIFLGLPTWGTALFLIFEMMLLTYAFFSVCPVFLRARRLCKKKKCIHSTNTNTRTYRQMKNLVTIYQHTTGLCMVCMEYIFKQNAYTECTRRQPKEWALVFGWVKRVFKI